ncbi:S1 family peptidase [Streptomyces sp. NPDC002889]|uniref:S1 family peptidase n=1 Tax=Streptomyces sp. NPDC002889 TaxID=3364669 RepID=UPI0036748748
MRRTPHARILLSLLLAVPALGLGSGTAGAQDPAPGPPGVGASPAQYALRSSIEHDLGERTAGSYLDTASGELVVTVTDAASAEEVRAAGARAELVKLSMSQLLSTMGVLEARAKIPGTSWGIDPRTNQVVVEADQSVSTLSMARMKAVAARLGDSVRITRVPGVFTKELAGGDAIYGDDYRCSAAFNVRKGTVRYFLTAGHCTGATTGWTATDDGASIGTSEGSSFPTNDYGLVRYAGGVQTPGKVNLHNGSYQDITSAADAIVGQAISKSGSTTKVTSGTVTAVNVTVNYGDGPVYGMVRTTVCSSGGDSGGAHFAGSTALGIHSGSAGCNGKGGSAIHQPVQEALSAYGVAVY